MSRLINAELESASDSEAELDSEAETGYETASE